MSKYLLVLGSSLLAVATLALLSCTSPGGDSLLFMSPIITPPVTTRVPPPILSLQDIVLGIELGRSAAPISRPVPLTITVHSRVDLPDIKVILTMQGPSTTRQDSPLVLENLRADRPRQITTTLLFPEEAEYFIKIHAYTAEGFQRSDSRRIRVTKDGIVVNPTPAYGPGTPAPAAPNEPRTTLRSTSIAPSPRATPTPFEHSGPISHDLSAANAFAGTVTLRGHVWFEDRDHAVRPAKYMWVKVWDWMDSTPVNDRFLGETQTDTNGDWVLASVPNSDPDGSQLDVYYMFETMTYGSAVPMRTVVRQNGFDYSWTTREFPTWDVPDGDQWVNPGGVSWTSDSYAGVWLFHDISRAWEHVTTVGGTEPGSIIAPWEPNVNSMGLCNSACYLPIVSPSGVFIPDVSSDTPDTVVHEIGHRYRHNALGLWFFADAPSYLNCAQHYIFSVAPNQRCAWSEGWETISH